MNVLIVPDKFKGTLTAQEAAETIARGWLKFRREDTLSLLPMSDGGDGFGLVMSQLLGAEPRQAEAVDAAHRPCVARWWWEPKKRIALVDSAGVIGLAMLKPNEFHPFELDTLGLGKVLRSAAENGADQCLIGIGGSATNDGGFGLARALGWRFLDESGHPIQRWTALTTLKEMDLPTSPRLFESCVVAVDVQNPLLGPRGATTVYGPQKGLQPRDFELADKCLGRLAEVARRAFGKDFAAVPGAGAAGGLGFGLLAFLSARLQPGFQLFAEQAALENRLRSADLVITGEGAIDQSTLMGKGVGQIGLSCRNLGIPCLALAGRSDLTIAGEGVFTEVRSLTEVASVERAQGDAARCLEELAGRIAASAFAERHDAASAGGNRNLRPSSNL